ncbi:N-acetylglucosamine-specific PTS transporter subunit IIBC [Lactococcus insecticola]|uniref:PTS N-acetylglucosamine transporter subunit IIABC n=1 Tax=Pseudolactococcus insecticola TaxID=2709158 RepID=A0A6A0BBA8_9LACT|nr:N-acetylglucosamine-specific PTS transporter subunit IIBC [Lactococcus insecticola]GFH41107.1 PTS N-acetylglucosamine transporter subunit IIABC [Lactococcus insecticola]
MKSYLQRMGRSLMLPVAVLPVAAIFMGIGYWIDPSGWGSGNVVSAFLIKAGSSIIDNMALLFAVGLGLGMSKDKDGSAALSGLVAFLVVTTLLAPDSVAMFLGEKVTAVDPAFTKIKTQAIGIICGLIAATCYNRFSNVKLPTALSFFSGKRLAPIMTAFFSMIAAGILFFVWPAVYNALVAFGKVIVDMGPVGAGIYGFLNRILIVTGLHHALNSVFWFDVAGINDIGNFWASKGVKGVTGMYQAGFFPVMMFGLPAGAFAMYKNARPEHKKTTASLMLAAGFASFFTGVTEPLEFAFMFAAFPLYVIHSVLTGLSLFIAAFFHWTAGFAFSAGLVDYLLSLRIPIANYPLMLLVQGVVFAFIYYFVFDFAIKKFNLMTPGREIGSDETDEDLDDADSSFDDKFAALASKLLVGLGGSENLATIDNCTTRLRLTVNDTQKVDVDKIKKTGVPGVRVLDDTNVQIIVGTEVQFVADELTKRHTGQAVSTSKTTTSASPVTLQSVSISDEKELAFSAVATGEIEPLSAVNDGVFSEKMMGDGFAIIPSDDTVTSPIDGQVTTIFPTKHAFGLLSDNGVEVLVHIGLDTVELAGAPFDVKVIEGSQVKAGQTLALVDFAAVKSAGKKTDIIVVITNSDTISHFDFSKTSGQVASGDALGSITKK